MDGDSLTVFSVGSAVNGSLNLAGGNLIFTPSPEFVGIASYNYSIHDGHSGVGTATARIFVGQRVTLTAHTNQTPGNYRFYLNGPTGVPYQILTSADLVQWTLWTNVVNTVTNQLIIDNTVSGSARRFYRVQAGP